MEVPIGLIETTYKLQAETGDSQEPGCMRSKSSESDNSIGYGQKTCKEEAHIEDRSSGAGVDVAKVTESIIPPTEPW
jgi:hypothetical protein